jgi:two-component system chemotaxis sensor kinase CheA
VTVLPDADVLALFEQEAAERIAALGELLLRLDGGDADKAVVDSLFREAHTLKGAAVVVGLDEIADVAHGLEEVLAAVRSGDLPVTPELVDRLFVDLDSLMAKAGVASIGADAARAVAPGEVGNDDEASVPSSTPARLETARVAVHRLDDLVRLAGEATAAHLRIAELLRDLTGADPHSIAEVRGLMRVLADLQEVTLRARMLPVGAMTTVLRRAVRESARRTGKRVRCEVRGEDTELDRHVHERLADALLHLLRNAVDHGIEDPEERRRSGKVDEGTILVHAMQLGSRVILTVGDDGAGVDIAKVRRRAAELGIDARGFDDGEVLQLLFRPGFSTTNEVTDVSGRGVGLDAVREGLAALRGRIEVASVPGEGTRFRISVPITLTLLPGLVVEVGGQRFALPMGNVVTVLDRSVPELVIESRPAVMVGERAVPLASMAAVLGLAPATDDGPVVVLAGIDRTVAVRVDSIGAQREVLVNAVPAVVPANDLVVGASAEPDGTILLVLDAEAIVEGAASWRTHPVAARASRPSPAAALVPVPVATHRGRILVVDDALTVRELQRTILERAGYQVTVAVDGRDALARLAEDTFDLVLTDVEMPELDGLELVRTIRADAALADLPVVVLTSRGSDDDKRAGMDAGADAYIVKSSFDEAALRSVVANLLGEAAA